jgi:hypothetical protein
MANTLADRVPARHRVISEMRPEMMRASLRKSENSEVPEENTQDIGGCLDYARRQVGWNLDELSAALKRDARQVRRWIANEETVQVQTVFKVPALRVPFALALAKLANCEIETVVRMRIL